MAPPEAAQALTTWASPASGPLATLLKDTCDATGPTQVIQDGLPSQDMSSVPPAGSLSLWEVT